MNKRSHNVFIVTLLIVLMSVMTASNRPIWAAEPVRVFAAASLQAAIDDISAQLSHQGIEVVGIYGASSSLARQIEHGAPADIYISANVKWTNYLRNINKLEPDQLRLVARNSLVVVSGTAPFAAPRMAFGPGYPLGTVLQNSRLAVGDPAHVPAGLYTKEALQKWGLWDDVKGRLAPARDVSGALLLVERGEARLGIVYASDLKRSDKVRVFAQIPENLHQPIVYPATIVRAHARLNVLKVLDYLTSPEGQAAFAKAGFKPKP